MAGLPRLVGYGVPVRLVSFAVAFAAFARSARRPA